MTPTDVPQHVVPLWRLNVLRAAYLLMIIGLAIAYLPNLFAHPPQSTGVIPSFLAGMWVMAWLGLRYPLHSCRC
ncbi:hypothetical protein [Sphingomonas sp.]|uniref:hypothetical protein n=1 Tax=Sphingomonas sp. TaxID=28214 RepID=UPI002E35C5AC|nr:hypothetical protein [Sphingomonas sp.]HEX4694525.1 hypothetical protein [Sphingomonas sp.]